MRIYFLILFLLFSFISCGQSSQKPDSLIPEEKYINLLVELQLVRSYSEVAKKDTLSTDSLANEVFKKYDISRQIFEESHQYYQKFPRQQKERINEAIKLLKMDQVKADSTQATPADSTQSS